MENQKSISKSVVATISALTLATTALGGGLAWFTTHNNQPQANTPSQINPNPTTVDPAQQNPQPATPLPITPNQVTIAPTTPSKIPTVGQNTIKPTTPTIAQQQDGKVKIWRLDDDGKKTILVSQDVQDPQPTAADNPEARVNKSLSTLIASAGKPDGKLTSTIPVGTKLLSTKVLADGIHVDLSKEFTQSGGATSAIGRLGQVVYTATAQDPDAQVWITVEGKKLEVLGEDGVEIRQPITRQTYDRDFPINPAPTNP
ncbi:MULTISPECIES: GerMN domain-containing protein [unclassified Chamaesiphon]|uniref:GerMN domain-containing protein n=1 Tax=unclassified Chamaesiphon TaxID=2620921 RepID=UPI00286AD48F|nr:MULTISPECIES: GerMN domain-containing protein [unclassified Chamaesiphon]